MAGEKFSAYNKPKRTPGHKTKSHAVAAKSGDKTKLIRFGQQGLVVLLRKKEKVILQGNVESPLKLVMLKILPKENVSSLLG